MRVTVSRGRIWHLCLGTALAALATTCGGDQADELTLTPVAASSSEVDATATQSLGWTPTVASLPSTASASPAAAIPIDAIGARLGGARESWIAEHGEPVSASPYERFGRLEVTWSPEVDGTQRAMTVEILYPSSGVSVGDARRESEGLMPTDSQPVGTYVASEGQTVEVFFSASLAAVLERLESGARDIEAGRLNGEPEGTFIRIAERGSPMTGRLLLAVGNSP